MLVLAMNCGAQLEALAKQVGLDAARRVLVHAHTAVTRLPEGHRLEGVAVLVHRLERGIRLV